MTKKVKPESVAFLVVLAVVGVLLTIVGAILAVQKSVFGANFFAALGAAIIGTACSLLMARVFEPLPINEIHHLLSVSRNVPVLAEDEKVRPRRVKYHGYLLSHAAGKSQWKYRVFDFSQERRPGYLHAKVNVWVPIESTDDKSSIGKGWANQHKSDEHDDTKNGHQVYFYDGYLCDPYHLVLVGRLDPDQGAEPDVIHVFPFGLQVQGNNPMAGLCFLETVDKKRIVTPTILSKFPQTSETEFGPVKDPREQANLLDLWTRHFMGDFKINVPAEKGQVPNRNSSSFYS